MTLADFYIWCYERDQKTLDKLKKEHKLFKDISEQFEKYKRKNTPNNKLKMQGKPMRRH